MAGMARRAIKQYVSLMMLKVAWRSDTLMHIRLLLVSFNSVRDYRQHDAHKAYDPSKPSHFPFFKQSHAS